MTGYNTTSFIITISLTFSLFSLVCDASSFYESHSHTGKVKPFEPGDPKVPLDGKAKATLNSGKPYETQIKSGDSGGRGLVVQDVNASTEIVWGRILDYDNYSNMVPHTIASKNYNVIKNKPTKMNSHSQTIYTQMKVGFPLIKLEFFVKHLYYPNLNSLTWTLDYSKQSDFDDSCGYWYVVPHPTKPGRTRVFYSVEVSMFDWVPKFVMDFMSKKALTDATGWVKKYSELESIKQQKNRDVSDVVVEEGKEEKVRKPFMISLQNYFYQDIFDLATISRKSAVEVEVEKETTIVKENNLSWTVLISLFLVGAISTYVLIGSLPIS